MVNKYFILETVNNNITKKHYVTIINNEDDDEYIINIGGLKNTCIVIQVPYRNNQAIILDISYHEKCCLKDLLKKNKDMIELIKCSLMFTLHNFTHITSFILSDNSYIECNNGIRISLADLYYLKYKKTWYEKIFNAFPQNEEIYLNIKLEIEELLDIKLEYDTELFLRTFYNISNFQIINKIRKEYKKNMTLRSFLDKMIKYECSYYSIIMNTFIPNKFKSLNWIITLNNIVDYNSNCNIIEIEKPIHEHKIINNKSIIERRHLEHNSNRKNN